MRGTVEAYERELGLDKPIVVQYFLYVGQLAKGDLGFSWWTGNEVLTDIMKRVPATLELVTISMIIIVVLGVLTGIVVGLRERRVRKTGLASSMDCLPAHSPIIGWR